MALVVSKRSMHLIAGNRCSDIFSNIERSGRKSIHNQHWSLIVQLTMLQYIHPHYRAIWTLTQTFSHVFRVIFNIGKSNPDQKQITASVTPLVREYQFIFHAIQFDSWASSMVRPYKNTESYSQKHGIASNDVDDHSYTLTFPFVFPLQISSNFYAACVRELFFFPQSAIF